MRIQLFHAWADNSPRNDSLHVVPDVTSASSEAGFTEVRIGYDPAEVDERLADLQTQLAISAKRSAALERLLRTTVAEATELLHRIDSETTVAAAKEGRVDRPRPSQQPDRAEVREASNTHGRKVAAPAAAPDKAQLEPGRAASHAVIQAKDEAGPSSTSPDRQWIRGTIRKISRTEAGATIWVVPEDQPQSVVSILFTNQEVGGEAVAYVCASFEVGEAVCVWHTDRHGHDIESI
jgi:hypothetical protein